MVPDNLEKMAAFAANLLREGSNPNGAFTAACKEFPGNPGIALWVAEHWPINPFVRQKMAELQESDPEEYLPKKPQIARELYKISNDERLAMKDRLKAYQLYMMAQGMVKGEDADSQSRLPQTQPVYQVVNT